MDGWSKIPHANDGKAAPSRSHAGLPAPGSTVVANVEEDLGEGMYSLRWAGQRINVFSRTPLQQGQAFLLKSETSPEGKPRLVVQGPAPQTPQIAGRVIYGPGHSRAQTAFQDAGQQTATQSQTPASRPQGVLINTDSEAGGAAPRPPQVPAGGTMTAGAARADLAAEPGRLTSMVGLVLEPLPDRRIAAGVLLNEAANEKAALQNPGGGDAARTAPNEAGQTASRAENKAGRSDRPGETAPPLFLGRTATQGADHMARQAEVSARQPRPGAVSPPSAGFSGEGASLSPARSAALETGGVAPSPNSPADQRSGGVSLPIAAPSAEGQRPSPARPPVPEAGSAAPPSGASSPQRSDGASAPVSGSSVEGLRPPQDRPSVPETGNVVPPSDVPSPQRSGAASPPAAISPDEGAHPVQAHQAGREAGSATPVPEVLFQQRSGAVPSSPGGSSTEAIPTPRPDSGIQLRPGTGTYARSLMPPNQNGAAVTASGDKQAPAPEIKPEILFKEALSQMVKAVEFPMGAPAADAEALGVSGRMPEAVLDKAAAILLRGAGLTPDSAAMEAAKALAGANVQVDRESVQSLLAATAGVEDGAQRDALLKAAARLSAKDVPLAAPLVSGLADIIDRKAGVQDLMANAMRALTPDPALPEAAPLMAGAKELLDLLHVDLDRSDAAVALERYVSTFGREALGKALALVETSAQTLLESNPLLQKIDQALALLYSQLHGDMEQFAGAAGLGGDEIHPSGSAGLGSPAAAAPPPASPRPGLGISAYLNAPRALPIEEMLKNLPPMPKIVSLGGSPSAIVPGPAAGAGLIRPPVPPPAAILPDAPAADPGRIPPGAESPANAGGKPLSGVLMTLDRLFQIPGLNRPEFELLRPGGLLDQYLEGGASGRDGGKVGGEAAKLLRELLSDNPVETAEARQEVARKEPAVLRETASRLAKMEAEAIRGDPVMNKLADAATSLRDLGRQLLAAKAENLAGQDRNPGVMLAEVPFKLNNDAGGGRMQMFYRRAQGKADGWTSRVILDLNTTRMGPVLGDMRFFGQDMILNLFVEEREAAEYLAVSAGELADALAEKGFRLKSKFMVLPPPLPPPALTAERPQIAGESGAEDSGRKGRLDIEM